MTSGGWRQSLQTFAAGLVAVAGLLHGAAAGQPARPCVGDCNGDGQVTVNEIVLLVNVALGSSVVGQCPAGDASRDGEIAINEIIRAVNNALGTCPAPTDGMIRVGSATGVPGGWAVVPVTLRANSNTVIATLNEIYFSAMAPVAAQPDGKPDCSANPQLGKDLTAFSYVPPGCTAGSTCTGVRAIVLGGPGGNPNAPIADGATLYTCTVTISSAASAGTYPLTCTPFDHPTADPYAFHTDPEREDFPAECTDGTVSVTQ